jgi:site-specific DNA-methyltransferase (adenine-specific)
LNYENTIICDECENVIPNLPDDSVDMIVTSPPYNVNLGKNKYNSHEYDQYDDNKKHDSYITWLCGILNSFGPKLKIGGRVCININDGKNGRIPTCSDLIQGLNYKPFAHIVWDKGHTSNRTAWGSWLSPSMPSFPTPFERILVFSKGEYKLQYKGETDLEREEFIQWANSIWRFKPENRKNHPAPFPLELPKRLIKMLSWKDAFIVDPFNGSGTTTLACKMFGRRYLGIDLSEEYCTDARDRIDEYD